MGIAYAKLLKDELATKKDIAILEEKMNAMEEGILRCVDNKLNQIKILIIIVLFAVILTNQMLLR
jgi:hypothetical protein